MLNFRLVKQNHIKIVLFTLVMMLLLSNTFTTAIATETIDNLSSYSRFDVSETLYNAFPTKFKVCRRLKPR